MRYILICLLAILSVSIRTVQGESVAAAQNVTWTSLGTNENDSMPIGNGDIAANVWTEQNGDLLLLLAKADAWNEAGQLVKLGRVRVHLTPNPFLGVTNFIQTLLLENSSVDIRAGGSSVRIWVDANHPTLHVDASLENPATIQADLEIWRTSTDTILPASAGSITWCHFNQSSYYSSIFRKEHLESIESKYPDPLLHNAFGGILTGVNMTNAAERSLKSLAPTKSVQIDLCALTQQNVQTVETWKASVDSLAKTTAALDREKVWQDHGSWWSNFWNRSWIRVQGTSQATNVSQGYAMQRYMMACSSRGAFPTKFNGGLFTVGHDLPRGKSSEIRDHDPDFRRWGECYWNQNNRLLYWPLIATGDYDLLEPWFGMYLKALPLAKERTQIYFHHDGASLPETMMFWGLPRLHDFGGNNPTVEMQSRWQRYHIQGTLEVIAQMLDVYDCTQDPKIGRDLVPFADAVVTYYAKHWPRDPDGKIHIAPAQSLETYQVDAVNPTPDIAGLRSVIPRLIALPQEFASAEQRQFWAETLEALPAIPMGKTSRGKVPPNGVGDPDGRLTILPAEKYGPTRNGENPELYVAFPYRLYGVGKPDLELAQNTFAARIFPQRICWGQDGPQAAVLGLMEDARKAVVAEYSDYGNQRFRWFWAAGHDWIPDLDNGGTGMITLQEMLMQCDGKRIQLLPAWPKDWSAEFKLHAPYQTIVEARVENGTIKNLKVMPETRAKDVVIVSQRVP